MALHTIELFAGVGMLGEGVRAGLGYLGIETRCVCYVEREAYAAAVLAARIESGALDPAPVWSDVCTFDARRWHGAVDCIVAGFPCQDLSVAGRRAGLDGARSGLFFEVLRIADDSGAELIVLENVAGIASATASVVDEAEGDLEERAAARVVGELADRGWNAEWLTLSASDVGASHGRERWFCVAWRHVADAARHERNGFEDGPSWSGRRVCEAGDQLADAQRVSGERQGESGVMARAGSNAESEAHERERRGIAADSCRSAMADARSPRQQGRELGTALHADRGGGRKHMDQLANFVAYSPLAQQISDGPTSSPHTPTSRRLLNPLFASWLMGWPSTWVIADPRACDASAMASYRSRLQQQLSCLLGERESSTREAA